MNFGRTPQGLSQYLSDTDIDWSGGLDTSAAQGIPLNQLGIQDSSITKGPAKLGISGLSMAFPAVGMGLQAVGGIMDYKNQLAAEKRMNEELDIQRSDRNYARQKHLSELNSDSARRNLMLRGQVANSPYYQQQLGKLAQQYGNTSKLAADTQQKLGMGDKAGMSAQVASQNLSQLGSQATGASSGALGGQGRVFGSLGGKSVSSQPEIANYDLANKYRGETLGSGGAFKGLSDLLGTASKHAIGEDYRNYTKDRIDEGYGIGKYGGA